MSESIINRDAGSKSKGFRMQKLRALSLLLDAAEKSTSALVLSAIEVAGDVILLQKETIIEENKNYAEDAAFSFNSNQVLKTMIIFLDLWFRYQMSEFVVFSFYSTSKIAKENSTKRSQDLGITFPKSPLLEVLASDQPLSDENVEILSKLILDEYETQYSNRENKGHLNSVQSLTPSQWKDFFNLIDWKFGMPDHEEIEMDVIEKIRKSRYFNSNLDGLEEYIKSYLLERFDKKQSESDFLERFIHVSEVENAFLKIEANRLDLEKKIKDPVFELWKQQNVPDDKRNIKEKLIAVCDNLKKGELDTYIRKAAIGKTEYQNFQSDKRFQSLRYRVYDHCQEILNNGNIATSNRITSDTLKAWFDLLFDGCCKHVDSLSKDFAYGVKSPDIIKGIVYELFDSCYLAFDEINEQN
ncbi:hypothetical protein CH370_09560 [Leptospira kmetyi]|uniref:hypothetical protein n=1 Tax=Leptospira kmetyi TaxID=408139 RepID=UPI000C29BD7B|nr:hypothetical protein [Leptospira kmetyi]PJZ41679.1 hypothetical protein CH370_09560 [Leptospira kmetyi]